MFLGFHHRMRESWKQPGRWYLHKWPSRARDGLDPRQDPRPHRAPLRDAAIGMGSRGPQPRPARLGQLLPLRQLRDGSSPRSTATSTNASRSSPAPSTRSQAATGSPASTISGANRLGVYRLDGTVQPTLRMPAGERCRRAVCGRTACTVRCGGGRHPGPVGYAVRSPGASRRPYSAATLTALLLRSLPDAKGKPYTPTLWPGMTTDDSCTQKRAAAWMTRPESLKGRVRGGTVQALLLAVSRNGKAPMSPGDPWRDPDQHGNGLARQDDQGGRRRESDRNHPQRQDRLRRVGTASSRSTR